jgi:hypothetical protein
MTPRHGLATLSRDADGRRLRAGVASEEGGGCGRQDKEPLALSFRSVSTPRRLNDIQVLAPRGRR